ncbi:MAG: hypothetical protein WC824_04360, partial [Bacteroidota bacterium]
MTILRTLQGMLFATIAAMVLTVTLSAQQHPAQKGTQQIGQKGSSSTVRETGSHESVGTEGGHTASDSTTGEHATGEHATGEHAEGGHGTANLTPSEEMMRVLEHKVENTPYIH